MESFGSMTLDAVVWVAIALCVSQSAMFSGLNLAMFGISRLRLEVEAAAGSRSALRILALREDANFLLTTILWGNVAVNVLLAQLSQSVMAGVMAFLFSTVLITFVGEIFPQAYFSRNAMRMGALMAPVLRAYQFLLYPVAKPTAKMLDLWLGAEGIQYFQERDLREVIKRHIDAAETDIDRLEGVGALNFLALDDVIVSHEGEPVHAASVVALPMHDGWPVFPEVRRDCDDAFLQRIHASGKKWIIITDLEGQPQLVLNANSYLRAAMFEAAPPDPHEHCHRPIVVDNGRILLGNVLSRLRVYNENDESDVVEHDLILLWGEQRRIITGADILGRLLRGIALIDSGAPADSRPQP